MDSSTVYCLLFTVYRLPPLNPMSRLLPALLLLFSTSAVADQGRAVIWKIEGENNTVYLAGSVHLLRPKDFPIPPNYKEVYEDSEELIFEIDTAVLNDPSAALKMQQLGRLQDGDTVANHITPETLRLLKKFLRKRELPSEQLMQMKPGMLALTLSSLEAMRNGARPDLGLEMRYGALAARDQKPTSGLETMEYQIGMFDDLTEEEADEMLRGTIENLGEAAEGLDKLIDAWRTGDIETMDELINAEFDENEKLRKVLLEDRNRNWIPRIEEAIAADHNVLVMVGAGHLVGSDSVIGMLEEKGYRPVQLTYDASAEGVPKIETPDKEKNKRPQRNKGKRKRKAAPAPTEDEAKEAA